MIEATQIRTLAAQAKIDPGIIEKDYVLSKLLMSLATLDNFGRSYVFKGGTALKKCYYPDWRFSEDLDFTSVEPQTRKTITALFEKAVAEAGRLFGVALRVIEYSQYPRKGGLLVSAQLKIGYDGPLRKSSGQKNNARIDIAFDEEVVGTPLAQKVFKAYNDDVDAELPVYTLEEIAAEKLRSILQRGKSRDYYDVWLLLGNQSADFSLDQVHRILKQKCQHRGMNPPITDDFFDPERTLEAGRYWERGLAHQLTTLPDFKDVLSDLRELLSPVTESGL